MGKVILYSAMSVDGFIATEDGGIDWLPNPAQDDDFGYNDFVANIGTTIMGNTTFQQTLTFGTFPYTDTKNYIISHQKGATNDLPIEYITNDIPKFVKTLTSESKNDIWLIGGGKINGLFLKNDLIDEMRLTVIPTVLGRGIPLFDGSNRHANFSLNSSTKLGQDIVQLIYYR